MKRLKLEICGKGKLLYAEENRQLYYRRNVLWLLESGKWMRLCDVPRTRKLSALSRSRFFERLMRLAPRCAAKLSGDGWLISVHGAVLRIMSDGTLTQEHAYRKGMNNPLAFTVISNLDGFDDGIAYGEYFGNSRGESVHIWLRRNGQWESVYAFPAGSIKHIHGIVPDHRNSCVYVLTGDEDRESAIWEFRNNFRECKKLVGGTQRCRSCVAFPWKDSLIYATDTPLEPNAICRLDLSSGQIETLADISGPVIYGIQHGENMVFATTVEPDSRIKGRRYLLSYKRGAGVKTWNSYLYIGNPDKGFSQAVIARKDLLPMGLFQFGTFQLPPASDTALYATGQSLIKYDGKTVKLQYE